MKTADIVILSLAIGFLIIGTHQLFFFSKGGNFQQGVLASYWIFMLASLLLIWFKWRKNKAVILSKNATIPQKNVSNTKNPNKKKVK